MLMEEKENLRNLNNKYKMQFEEMKEKLMNYQDMNQRLSDHIKILDGKNINTKYKLSAMKKTINDKITEINILKEELFKVENFRKQKNDREILMNNYLEAKEELDKKTKKKSIPVQCKICEITQEFSIESIMNKNNKGGCCVIF